jgi:hypothetical protein
MKQTVYQHADGGSYALLVSGIAIKDDATGAWVDGVLYVGTEDEQIRATSLARWQERFTSYAYEGDDPAVLAMLKRANLADSGFDFIRVFESWGEREANLTAVLLDLAIAATMHKCGAAEKNGEGEITITTADLRDISQTYEIERSESPQGWTIKLTRLDREIISDEG